MKNILEQQFLNLGSSEIAINASSIALSPLIIEALKKHGSGISSTVHHSHEEGSSKKDLDYFKSEMESAHGRLLFHYSTGVYETFVWVWDHGVVELESRGAGHFSIDCISSDHEFTLKISKLITSNLAPKVKKGHVFSIIRNGMNLSLSNIGNAGIPLVKDNYSKPVLDLYQEVVSDLNSESPAGRIAILEGEPGTGKTHLVKSLLLDVPDAMFVLIPPDMLTSLAGPELLPLLLTNKNHYANEGPIVLVLEDADLCLVKRSGDNMNSIQTLLNLSDGILGSLLDLRIVATTNANKLEIEEAILRPGRLSQRIEVGPLSKTESSNLFRKLVPEANNQPLFKEKNTLAVVYSQARKAGWKPAKKSK